MDKRRLKLPDDVVGDNSALELISVWHWVGKVKIMSRDETTLDNCPDIWGEIVAALIRNLADHISDYSKTPRDKVISDMVDHLTRELK